ncbi:hypothetical protein ACFL56_03355 [Candidatus Margulisiibacteriota bacterium]
MPIDKKINLFPIKKNNYLKITDKESLEKSYQLIWKATEVMVAEGKAPKSSPNFQHHAVPLICNISELDISILKKIVDVKYHLKKSFKNISFVPDNIFHLSIFIVIYDIPLNEYNPKKHDINNKIIAEIEEILKNTKPIEIDFSGVNLGPDGGSFIEGHVKNDEIFNVRKKLENNFPNKKRRTPLVHISLGRIVENISKEEFAHLYNEIKKMRKLKFGITTIKNCRLVTVKDRFGYERDKKEFLLDSN